MFVLLRIRVRDYEVWKSVFDGRADARIRHGALGHRVLRDDDDPNALTLILELASSGGAISLVEYDVSTLAALGDGGVEGGPHRPAWQIDYLEEADAADYSVRPAGYPEAPADRTQRNA